MAATYGIAGTLVGVILGAILTRWIDFTYQRRREIREAVEAALVLQEELLDVEASVQSC